MMIGMLAATTLPPLIWRDPPAVDEVDALASEFLRQESETASAYATAIRLDEQLEVMRERLILCVEQFGAVNGKQKLVGLRHKLVVTFPTATVVDPDMVECFRLALLKAPQPNIILKIFTQHVSWSLAPGASDAIATLPKNLRVMGGRCLTRRVDPPVLEVRPR